MLVYQRVPNLLGNGDPPLEGDTQDTTAFIIFIERRFHPSHDPNMATACAGEYDKP